MPNLRWALLFVSLAVLAGWTAGVRAQAPAGQPPTNVVWLVAEDMSPWLGCYGDDTVATPNCDRLAREGLRYTSAFATSPVCAPARSSLITGMYATRIGTMHMRNNSPSKSAVEKNPEAYRDIPGYEGVPPAFVRCFPEHLRAAGYYCTNAAKKDYQFRAPATVWDESSGRAHWRNRGEGQPFFAVFNYNGTHESRTFPKSKPSRRVVDAAALAIPPIYPDTANVREALRRTYDNIAAMDRWVGSKLAELERAGLLDSTVVMFYSDHGVGLPRGKRSCYDTGTRVPLLVRLPDGGDAAGKVEDRVVQFVDFGPTVLSLCGIRPDQRLDGVPFLGRFARDGGGYAYSHADRFDAVYDRQRSVSDGRFRYVRNYATDQPYLIANAYRERIPMTQDLYDLRGRDDVPAAQWQMAATQRPKEELYDSARDPWETNNLCEDPAQLDPAHEERLLELRSALARWMAKTDDLGFVLPESKLVRERIWPPSGEQPQTKWIDVFVETSKDVHRVTILCEDAGASIGYRMLPLAKGQKSWRVYREPFAVKKGARLEVLAHRIGHKPRREEHTIGSSEGVPDGTTAGSVATSDAAKQLARPQDSAKEAPRTGKNVIVIVADDLGFMDIGANNPECCYDTPNIDRLAASGMRFTDGYASCPVCSPTRYSLLTGRYPARGAVTNWFMGRRSERFKPAEANDRMALQEVTLAEELRERGYATFFAGKWHLGPTEAFWPEHQGFDVNMGGWKRGGPYGPGKYFVPYGNPRLEDGPDGEHLPERLAREACDFMAENRDGRFLAYLSFYSVHTPLVGRKDLVAKYKRRFAAMPLPDGVAEFGPEEQVYASKRRRLVRQVQRHAVYAAMVEAMDLAVGQVLDKLDALGLADDTIVIFTSDNGGLSTSEGSPTSNLPLRGGKGWMYEGGIREPWIFRVPGVTKAGTTSAEPISSVDLMPTVLALAGKDAAVKQAIDGVDASAALRGQALPERALFWHYPHYGNQGGFPSSAIRLGRYKLIQRLEDGRVHLYDLTRDPGERSDLAEQQPERTADLRGRLHAWRTEMGARYLRERDGRTPWRPDAIGK